MLRIRSVGEPFTSPRLALKGTVALARADAMGLLEERDEGLALDATIFGRLAARLRKAGIGGTVVPTLTAVTKEPALFEQCLDQLNDALEASPVPSRLHWLALIVGDLAGAYNEIGTRQW